MTKRVAEVFTVVSHSFFSLPARAFYADLELNARRQIQLQISTIDSNLINHKPQKKMSSESTEPSKQTPRPTATEGGVDRVEQIARLDQRINERTNSNSSFSPPANNASMSRVEHLVFEKQRNSANAKGAAWSQPGAFAVRDVDDGRSRLERQMNALEDRIAAPPFSSAPSSMRKLEAQVSAKVASESGHTSSTRSLDGNISPSSKISVSSEPPHPNLNEMESAIADKVRHAAQQPSPSEAAREQLRALERLVATKNSQTQTVRDSSLQSGFSDGDPLSTRDLPRTTCSESRSSRNMPLGDDQRGLVGSSGDSFDHADEWDHGVEHASRSIAVAVAVPVEEDREPIPAAVEYDPDAKQPIVRNRRFRLYGILALFLLILVAVGIGVGINLSKNDNYDHNKAFAHRENLGIRESVKGTVGKEVLEDASSPYSKALRWIMYHDPMELVPGAPNFMQRYILAYFYYATSVEKPWASCNPPTGNDAPDSCLLDKIQHLDNLDARVQFASFRWLSGVPECLWAGVTCDAFNQARSIVLCKFNWLVVVVFSLLNYCSNPLRHVSGCRGLQHDWQFPCWCGAPPLSSVTRTHLGESFWPSTKRNCPNETFDISKASAQCIHGKCSTIAQFAVA